MRAHPVAGGMFLVVGLALFAAGALGRWSPPDLPGPLPASVVIPFVLWQLAVWSILFAVFFLRPRTRRPTRPPRFAG